MTDTTNPPARQAYPACNAWLPLAMALASLAVAAPAMAADRDQTASMSGAVADKAAAQPDAPAPAAPATTRSPVLSGAEMPDDTFYGPPAPKAHRGAVPAIDWTRPGEYVPPALDEAINIVTANYPSAQSARAALSAAASDVNAARWLRFPSVSANMQYLDNESTPQPQLIVEAPIWSGGRIGSNIRRAKAREDASSAQYVETVEKLALTTSQTYFEVARLTQREHLLEGSLKEHQALVETMERRVKQEISPLADLELARSRAAQIEQEYTTTVSQRRTTLRVLAELIADPTYDLGPIPAYDPDVELANRDALEEQSVAYSPTLKRLHALADAARADADSRKAAILPQFSAQYSYDDFYKSRVGVVVKAQNTGGLSQFSEVTSARLRIQSALEDIRESEQQLRRDVESTLIQYDAAKKRAEISKSAASTAARVSESYTRQFIAGRRSWLDVMNALREAVTAAIGRSDAEVTVMATATQLQLQSGRWRPVFRESEQ